MRAICWLSILLGAAFLAGCDEPPPTTSATSSTSAPPPPPPGATDIAGPTRIADQGPSDDDVSEERPAADNGAADNGAADDGAAEGYERGVLAVGADKRGRNYGGGVISEPIRQYFRAGQRINLLNLQHAMDLYKASNDNKLPTTHEQFMKEIVEANAIELPELPDGERYVYDPQRGELMVERPKP